MNFKQYVETLEAKIINSHENGTTLVEAEKLAGEFLAAQMRVSAELAKVDLDSRMRRTGVKAVKAGVYMDAATKDVKKPTEAALSAIIDTNEIVIREQNDYDGAEVIKAEYERLYSVFQNAHIFYRTIAKSGAF